mmetsp:Transcript_81992/g.244563  ORF Transcript_81992/g.244563 Transcript_81992/m.244563 type:complete len:200 (+) Transcript_81992:744-1343(+)
MYSSTVRLSLAQRASWSRTLQRPLGASSRWPKSASTASGNSASDAMAATSQQLPMAPWRRSLGPIPPWKRPQAPARRRLTGTHSGSPPFRMAGMSPIDRGAGGKSLSTNSAGPSASTWCCLPAGSQTRSTQPSGHWDAWGEGASPTEEKYTAALAEPAEGSAGPKCQRGSPPKRASWKIHASPVVRRKAGRPPCFPRSS